MSQTLPLSLTLLSFSLLVSHSLTPSETLISASSPTSPHRLHVVLSNLPLSSSFHRSSRSFLHLDGLVISVKIRRPAALILTLTPHSLPTLSVLPLLSPDSPSHFLHGSSSPPPICFDLQVPGISSTSPPTIFFDSQVLGLSTTDLQVPTSPPHRSA